MDKYRRNSRAIRLASVVALSTLSSFLWAAGPQGAPEVIKPVTAILSGHAEREAIPHPELVSSASASSTLDPGKTATYSPSNVFDDNPASSWVEGQTKDGIGERLILIMAPDSRFHWMQVVNGYASSAEDWKKNNRVKELGFELTFGDGRLGQGTAILLDTMEPQDFNLNFERSYTAAVTSITFTIKSVYAGTKYQDTCLAEIVPALMPPRPE